MGRRDITWLLVSVANSLYESAFSNWPHQRLDKVSERNGYIAISQALSVLNFEANLMDEKLVSW